MTGKHVATAFALLGWIAALATIAVTLFVPALSTERLALPFVLAILCIIVGHIDRIETFKAGLTGIEGKTRELEDAVKEVRQLAAIVGRTVIPMLAAEGRWGGGTSMRDQYLAREELLSSLAKLGLPKNDLDEIARSDRRFVIIDYCTKAAQAASTLVQPNGRWRDDITLPRWEQFWRRYKDGLERPSSTELRAFFRDIDATSPDLEAILSEMEIYERTSRVPNTDRFLK